MFHLRSTTSLARCIRWACLTSRPLLQVRMASSNPKYLNDEEPYAEFKERFMCAFNRPNLDGWWMRKYLQDLHLEDIIPEPDIVIAIFKACRRINDLALAIRYLESLHHKCEIKPELFPWLMQEVGPTMKELGIPTLEELGYDKPELYTLDYDD
ncbi:cytochrome c oxidase subunit Va [Echinococcus multilocularis]|uniref:Cytochrome c oxidase subunit 5A, mitochondrial n=1 Tax=Echinococcus multilocularis TaxID=6211 RepID=A0A068YCX6_ECHMU|nr:cytochrome c oxidase subunit Va [Echinococcus multilocularis]